MKTLGPKDPEEIKLVKFPFANELEVGETLGSLVVTCTVLAGADAGYATVLLGAPVLIGTDVVQRVQNGLDGVSYMLRAKATGSSGLVHVVPGVLEVKTAET